jgi:hypothetical protein
VENETLHCHCPRHTPLCPSQVEARVWHVSRAACDRAGYGNPQAISKRTQTTNNKQQTADRQTNKHTTKHVEEYSL